MSGILQAIGFITSESSLYTFSTLTFTSAGITGNTIPTLAQFKSSYNTSTYPWLNDTNLFNVSNGIQLWTVPTSGTYVIDVYGAQGSTSSGGTGGNGARMVGTFTLTKGSKLRILVGQKGLPSTNYGGGGGGGTFVMKETGTTASDIYVIAGGGGGAGYSTYTTGVAGTSSTAGTANADNSAVGGDFGLGGAVNNSGSYPGGGGGGLTGNGATTTLTGAQGPAAGGARFSTGGAGGISSGTVNTPSIPHGGFGGGGAGTVSGGGGGGYSGGGGGSGSYSGGGGGGSYNNGANQTNLGGQRAADGMVIITKI